MTDFQLDSRLAADTHVVTSLALCDVLLMNDSRFPWLILVPRRGGVEEIGALPEAERTVLWNEVDRASRVLADMAPGDKLNIGALGNIVRQLHVHVVMRQVGDAAWPGPVWGSGKAVPYDDAALANRIDELQARFAA